VLHRFSYVVCSSVVIEQGGGMLKFGNLIGVLEPLVVIVMLIGDGEVGWGWWACWERLSVDLWRWWLV